MSLTDRFTLERTTIQDFLNRDLDPFDLIICNDVLHHIFITAAKLDEAPEFEQAVELFAALRKVMTPDGRLIIIDAGRTGLRQTISGLGVGDGNVDYSTKQAWQQWGSAAHRSGWTKTGINSYVPFGLRRFHPLLNGRIGRLLVCDRYILHLRQTEKA